MLFRSILLAGTISIVAIAVVAFVVLTRGSSDDTAAKRAPAHVMEEYIGSVGEVGTDEALRTAIGRRGPVDVGLGTGASTTSILTGSGLSIAAERCVRVNLPGKSVTLLATGTWQGQVAAVWVAEVTGARVAFVSDLSSCTILYSLRL